VNCVITRPFRYIILPLLIALTLALIGMPAQAVPAPDIKIDGGSRELRDNVRQYLTIVEESCSAPLWRLKSLLVEADDEIEKAAQALGYYQLTFTTDLSQANDCWQLRINLTPGEQVKVTEFNLFLRGDGADDESFKPLITTPSIKVGDSLHHGTYENLKTQITTKATGEGYFDGRFDVSRVIVNAATNTANIELIYNTGTRYRIGEIRMTHNILDEKFLRRYLNIKSGDYYDTDKLLELKSYYNSSNYFSVAMASPDLQHLHDNTVDIDVQLEERKRRAYSVGIGASASEGGDASPRVLLGFEDRYVNDSGHSIKADASKSALTTDVLISYNIPMKQPFYEFVKIYTGIEEEETDTAYSDKRTLGVSYTNYQKNRWLHTYAINMENEYSRVGSKALSYSHLIIPSVTFSRIKTDGKPYPLMGWSLLAKLSGSPNTLGSDVSYEQFYARAKYIHSLTYGRLLVRGEIGLTDVNGVQELPKSVRYFAGGGNSVRGYDYESLGPIEQVMGRDEKPLKDADGNTVNEVVGGKNLLVSSIEYDYQFRPSWAAAVFFDVGNAAKDYNFDLKRGAGIGLRWISPIGPVRIDVARGLDDLKAWNLHISMGPDL
jgi:translocation and assembly module TamA